MKELKMQLMKQVHKLALGYGEKGFEFSAFVAVVGSTVGGLLGGWDEQLKLLLVCIVLDFVLGFLAAAKAGRVDSQVMLWGGVNKVLVLVLVAVGVRLDATLGLAGNFCRGAVCWFYIGREGLSMVENSGKLGFPWPGFVVELLEQMKEQGDKGKEKSGG